MLGAWALDQPLPPALEGQCCDRLCPAQIEIARGLKRTLARHGLGHCIVVEWRRDQQRGSARVMRWRCGINWCATPGAPCRRSVQWADHARRYFQLAMVQMRLISTPEDTRTPQASFGFPQFFRKRLAADSPSDACSERWIRKTVLLLTIRRCRLGWMLHMNGNLLKPLQLHRSHGEPLKTRLETIL